MKKSVLLLLLVFSMAFSANAQSINWVTLEEAIALQKQEPKKIIIDMYANWCGPCKLLDKNTFSNSDVIKYVNENYYAVKFNAEGNSTVTFNDNTFSNPGYKESLKNRRNATHQLTRYLGVGAYPTMVFLDEEANLLTPLQGYKTPQQLELFLKLFQDKKYLEIDTQEKFQAYYENFKPEFSN